VRASELFDQHNILHDVERGVEVEWPRALNGGPCPPNEGDVIIYPYVETKIPWGHVGVISHIEWLPSPMGSGRDGTGQCVAIAGIAEQNIHARSWGGRSYGRRVALIKRMAEGQPSFTLEEHEGAIFEDCLGWKPVRDLAPRAPSVCNILKLCNTLLQGACWVSRAGHHAALDSLLPRQSSRHRQTCAENTHRAPGAAASASRHSRFNRRRLGQASRRRRATMTSIHSALLAPL
jgi:hypothetical protein